MCGFIPSGDSVNFTVLDARAVYHCELKSCEEQVPTGLPRIQPYHTFDIFQIFMVCDYSNGMNHNFFCR